jgi:hypothetical protein
VRDLAEWLGEEANEGPGHQRTGHQRDDVPAGPPTADVGVRVVGAAGAGLTVEVHNTASGLPPAPGPTAGLGLAGLAERVALAGGRLEHRAVDEGRRVSAWLPWPP